MQILVNVHPKEALPYFFMAKMENNHHWCGHLCYGLDNTHIPITCITDNKSLSDAVASTKIIEDKRLYIDICSLCDMLSHKEINEVKWTTFDKQLADCLTKRMKHLQNA